MDWAKTYLKLFNDLVQETPFSSLELAFGILTKVPGDNVIIMGLDTSTQLKENLRILGKNKIDNKIADEWWSKLPVFPEKFLNPSLWN
jgi:hypothetical protein